jgi:hypothetical protein
MMIPANFSLINYDMLEFSLHTENDLYDPETQILGWEIVSFTEEFMIVEFDFNDA